MVYIMLLESSETNDPAAFTQTDLYRQCVAAGVIPASTDDLVRLREQEKDEPVQRLVPDAISAATDTLALNLKVDGMWCTACAWVIEKSVARLAGVHTARCNFSTDRLRCRYRPAAIAPDQIREAVTRLGYRLEETDSESEQVKSRRSDLSRLLMTALLSANVMMLSWALYAGFFTTLSQGAVAKISLPIVAMATAVMLYGGGPLLRRAWFGFVHRMPGMETLVGLAAGCAYGYSLYNWLAGSLHLYFDTACMLITLVLLGKFLEQQAKNRVRQDLDSFFDLQPAKVRQVSAAFPNGRYVAVDQLAPGDRYAVEAEEIVPADGRVVVGTAAVDESSLTGEPRPVTVSPGDAVKSGTRLISGKVTATAEQVGADTILGQMIRIMARSLEQKSDVEAQSDRMLRWFVPVILAAAAGTGLVCLAAGLALHTSLVRAVTVLVISCPCALGVAIPMARLAGISLAGRDGILVRDIEAFELADVVDTLVFDKTGTLTRGRWQLERIECRPGFDEATVVGWAAGLERSSNHEIARSIMAYARRQGIAPAAIAPVSEGPQGVTGRLDGQTLRIGKLGFSLPGGQTEKADPRASDDRLSSRVLLSVDGAAAATLVFGDAVRPTVTATVRALADSGYRLYLLSGDGHAATLAVGRRIGIPASRGDLLPSDKAAFVKRLKAKGHRVAMVGDGINDAAALACADLAVAVYAGTGLAKEAAHITFMRGDPAQLLDFFPLARRVNRKVGQNLWCAWVYNLIGVPVAMSGLLTPLVAATAMLLSSLTVIGNTLRMVRQRARPGLLPDRTGDR